MKKIIIFCSFFGFLLNQENNIDPVFTGSFGSTTLNEKIFNQFSIRPEFSVGKIGVGLDIYFYFDENGNLYDENWNFSSSSKSYKTLIDKIYYIRWGYPTDDLYFRIGSLPNISMGYGSLVNSYSNIMDYPRVRRTGFNLIKKFSNYELGIVHSNLKNIREPAIFGISNSFEFIDNLIMNFVLRECCCCLYAKPTIFAFFFHFWKIHKNPEKSRV